MGRGRVELGLLPVFQKGLSADANGKVKKGVGAEAETVGARGHRSRSLPFPAGAYRQTHTEEGRDIVGSLVGTRQGSVAVMGEVHSTHKIQVLRHMKGRLQARRKENVEMGTDDFVVNGIGLIINMVAVADACADVVGHFPMARMQEWPRQGAVEGEDIAQMGVVVNGNKLPPRGIGIAVHRRSMVQGVAQACRQIGSAPQLRLSITCHGEGQGRFKTQGVGLPFLKPFLHILVRSDDAPRRILQREARTAVGRKRVGILRLPRKRTEPRQESRQPQARRRRQTERISYHSRILYATVSESIWLRASPIMRFACSDRGSLRMAWL